MKNFLFALLLVSSFAFAQAGASSGGISRGNNLRVPDYKTTGTASWFLDPTGSDTNNCTSVSTPCATIIGLQAKMPKLVRNPVTITMANGNYTGGWFSGFNFDPTDATIGAYITLQGTLTTFAPATGSATGTATSAVACALGPPLVNSSLTDSGATWTVNNLRGQILETTGGTGSGQFMPIESNTATTITIAGCWGTTPSGTTTYAIRDWGANITTTTNLPPNFVSAAGNASGLGLFNMQDSTRNNNSAFFFIDSIRVNVSTTSYALLVTNSTVYARRSRFDSTAAGVGVNLFGNSRINFQNDIATSATGQAFALTDFEGGQGTRIINSYFQSGATANAAIALVGAFFNISTSTVRMTASAAQYAVLANEWSGGHNFQGLRIYCTAGGSTIGILADSANNSLPFVPSGPHGLMFDSGGIYECATAVSVSGSNVQLTFDDSTLQATAGTTAIAAQRGATVNLDANTAITGSFATQVNLDSGGLTATFTDVASSGPLRTSSFNTGITPIP